MIYTYLLVLFFSFIVPFIFSFHPKLQFNKHFLSFIISNFLVTSIFLVWDIIFTKIGVWGFNPRYVMGFYFYNLPLEEVMFFILIPFSCVFTYHCLNTFYNLRWKNNFEKIFILCLSGILILTGFIFISKLYTGYTFISLGIILLILKFVLKVNWLAKFIRIYPILLIPFFIVNGILTGSCIPEPIVWYNDNENLGIRLITIPFEDIFYGFELLILNILFYEYFKTKINNKALLNH